ncbi:MAG: hypothetical protein ABL926_01400 [Novosphingobium sp.]|uniref:hypothetical protein n=1 Tax=Novosphingobium sp. TaxID=1874826 RepID=UPI0032B815EF
MKILAATLAVVSLIGLASPVRAGLVIKSAFEHELSINCPNKKAGFGSSKRYSYLDLALKTVSAKEDETPPLTPAMIDARVAAANAGLDKALAECQQENDWTDDEREAARDHAVASAGLRRSFYALGMPPEALLFAQFDQLEDADIQAITARSISGSPRLVQALRDLQTSDWARNADPVPDFDNPAMRAYVVDAYACKLEASAMRARFKASAAKRFPA